MTWQKVSVGILVAAGLAITGTVVWESSRPQVKAIDMITLMQAARERCFATQVYYGSNYWCANRYIYPGGPFNTNKVLTWGADDASGLFWVTGATNGGSLGTNNYKTVSAVAYEEIGHTNFLTDEYNSPYIVDPELNYKHYHTATSNKYIWGPYTTLEFSGFLLTDWNGSYSYIGRSGDVDYWYLNGTDTTHQLRDYGPRDGQKLFDPALVGFLFVDPDWADRPYYGSCILCDASGTAYYWTEAGNSPQYGQWRYWDLWTENPIYVTVNYSGLVTQAMRDAWVITEETQDNVVDWTISLETVKAITNKLIACAPYYVDATYAGGAGFEGCSNLPPVSNLTFSITGGVCKATNFIEIAAAAAKLKWFNNPVPSWALTNWLYSLYGIGSGSTWEDAKANVIWYLQEYYYPMKSSWGTFDGTTYHAGGVISVMSRELANIYTGNTHSCDFYIKAVAPAGGVFDDNGDDVIEGVFHLFASNAVATTNYRLSVSVGSTNKPVWCDEPTVTNSTSRGWVWNDDAAVLKWDFNYCTNSP